MKATKPASPPSRRAQPRITVQIPVRIFRPNRPQEAVDAEIRNISLGGAYIECRVPMEVNQELMVEIHFGEGKLIPVRVTDELAEGAPETPGKESALSRVRWTEEKATAGFGVEFSTLGSDTKKYLSELVAYFDRLTKAGVTF